jgi:predicted MFS family arabinose efflux permease
MFWAPVIALALLVLARVPEALMLLRLQDLGVPVATIPLVWAALHVVRSGGSYPGGRLSDTLGPRWTIAAGAVLFAAVVGTLALALGEYVAIAVFLALGLVAGLTESAERAMVARLAPVKTGRGFGGYHALTGLAALPAGILFGELYQRLGGGAAFGVSAAAVLLAAVGWMVVAPRNGSARPVVPIVSS